MSRGYVIMAQNTAAVDYVKCAKQLEKSIKRVMPDANVTIITSEDLPYGDLDPDSDWKLINDWQVYEASPYDETIKIEADMLITRNIDHWWDTLAINDVVVATTIRDFLGVESESRIYRKFIDDNHLPNCYNALTYFKKSDFSKQFFTVVRDVFENWNDYIQMMKCNLDEKVSTDWAYSIACHIMGVEHTTLPSFKEFSMVHMKQYINNLSNEDWTKELVCEFDGNNIRINTRPQVYPLHYHVKDFSSTIENYYG